MVAFTFVLKKDGDSWAANRLDSEEGEALTAEGEDTYRCKRQWLASCHPGILEVLHIMFFCSGIYFGVLRSVLDW